MEPLERAITAARAREALGYFAKAKAGDQRAASLFARLVAYDLNPQGSIVEFGWLTKSPAESNVEGYAEDAIVLGNDPAHLSNVIDLINGAGAPGASIGGAWKPRRPTNLWVAPKPLTAEEFAYLGASQPPVQPPAPCVFPPRNEGLLFFADIDLKYKTKGYPAVSYFIDKEGTAVWYADYLRHRTTGLDHAAAQAKVFADIDKVWNP